MVNLRARSAAALRVSLALLDLDRSGICLRIGFYSFWGLALTASAGWALEPSDLFLIQKGPTALKPQFRSSLVFTDNITFRDEDKLSDLYALISPGLAFQVGSHDYNYLDLSYFFERLQYFQHQEFDANQHRFAIENRFQRSRFTLDGVDRIEMLSSPLGGGYSLAGAMVDRTSFADHYRLTYSLSDRTAVYTAIAHSSLDYQDDIPLYDSRTLIGTLGFMYRAFTRTFFFGELYYGTTENDANPGLVERAIRSQRDPSEVRYPTARFIGGFIGARGYFTEKLSGTVKAGFEQRDYSGAEGGGGAPVVDASLSHRLSERTLITLAYSRRQLESVEFVSSSYVSDSVSASVRQQIGADGRLRADLTAGYINSVYDSAGGADREDNIVTTALTITYDIKLWMRVFGGYNFEWLDSGHPTIVDYVVNRFSLGIELGF